MNPSKNLPIVMITNPTQNIRIMYKAYSLIFEKSIRVSGRRGFVERAKRVLE